ncbi:MAG: tRNA (adenosine(37)-N6)-threonylcarbamoyltransferase complex transferase subunit TsaD [Alphaproteobacteria bacterium]|nr:tRNA (adenosine(37)-N6)-threonylcarbamoyltransferase complex transferase subunit TsaD [Alphaproteobacteria bacterium]
MSARPELILGIETSCDETAAAVVTTDGQILSNVIASQFDDHRAHGGVVPEVAARAHLSQIDTVIHRAMGEAGADYASLAAVAATGGPGLIGGVLVGTVTAKAIAAARQVPYFAVNHLEGHALTARLTSLENGGISYPYLLLLVSGGHTQLLAVSGPGQYRRYGTTLDDAAGEAFDKSAKILGLDLPGGPRIEALAKTGDDAAFDLPRPLAHKPGCHFSFSGLKTAVRTAHQDVIAPLTDAAAIAQKKADLAASLEKAIADSLTSRSRNAMRRFRDDHGGMANTSGFVTPGFVTPGFVLAGGVGANQRIRSSLMELSAQEGFAFNVPPVHLCTDNAVMIAWAAAERMAAGLPADDLDFAPRPRWPLDPDAAPPPGRGVKT